MPLARRLALLLALEGVLLIGLGIFQAIAGLSDSSQRLPVELAAGLAVFVGLAMFFFARGADRGKGWMRVPAVMMNIFPFPISLLGLVQAGYWYVAVPMCLLAGTVLYLFATPELRLLYRERT